MAAIRLPYIKKIENLGRLSVWLVDGSWVRTNLDEEFNSYGHHYTHPAIPENELWVDQEAHPDEQQFFIDHLLVEQRLMAEGKSYEKAVDAADRKERAERHRAGDLKRLTNGGKHLPNPEDVHVRLWKKMDNGVFVWIVNGRLVRSGFDIDFTEGGHDHVYEFIPQNEVWIDDDIQEKERPYVLLHELHERNLMTRGWTYEKAHTDSSRLEFQYRHRPDEVHDALSAEGWM
jgi:hypothetical protein